MPEKKTEKAEPEVDEDLDVDGNGRIRPFWSGTISFGLVTIPVGLYPASRGGGGVSMRMLAPDGTPLRRRYYCPEHDEPLDSDEIVRGQQTESGEFVVLTDEELEALAPEASRDIDLQLFVDRSELSPLFFERSYFLTPDSPSTKAYRLLAKTLEESSRAGIATLVLRGSPHVVAIVAEDGILRADTLRFANEVRSADTVGLPESGRVSAARVKKLRTVIHGLSRKALSTKELTDDWAGQVEALAEEKSEKGGKDVIDKPAAPEATGAQVIDLIEVLRQSMATNAKPAPKKARAKHA